jgi:hypothetical protein
MLVELGSYCHGEPCYERLGALWNCTENDIKKRDRCYSGDAHNVA